MKSILIRAVILLSIILGSCGGQRSPYHEEVVEAARRDAKKVLNATPGSMEQEKAVLAIRVRQHAMKSNGHEKEAELYFETARELLEDSLGIIKCREIDEQ